MNFAGTNQPNDFRRLDRLRGVTARVLPAVLWGTVLVVTLRLYRTSNSAGTLIGHAENQTLTVSYAESGVVSNVYVGLHEDVSQSQILVTMDDRQDRIALARVQKDVERLSAEVSAEAARFEAANAAATVSAENLGRRFLLDREDRHLEYLTLLVQDATDRVLLRGASTTYEILRTLYDEDNGAFRELNDILTERDSLSAKVTARGPLLKEAKAAFESADRRWAQFAQQQPVEHLYDRVLDPLRLAIDVRQYDTQDIVARIDRHVLRSPIAGQVTFLSAAPGVVTQPGMSLLAISTKSTNHVVAYLPEDRSNLVQAGDKVTVQPATPGRVERHLEYVGVIESLAAIVDEIPMHDRPVAAVPAWGRAFVVALDKSVRLVPGQKVRVVMPVQHW